jgi:tetratricopeptide (TPR) repeat protein
MAILADALRKNGEAERAVAQAQEALDVALATEDRACAGWALRAQSLALGALGQYEAARNVSDRAIALFVELQAPLERAKALLERAELELTAQAPERALHDLQHAEQLFKATGVAAPLVRVVRLRAAILGRCEQHESQVNQEL